MIYSYFLRRIQMHYNHFYGPFLLRIVMLLLRNLDCLQRGLDQGLSK